MNDGEMKSKKLPYACVKRGCAEYRMGEIRASGGIFSSLFDFATERFSYVSCDQCRYTEFYQANLRELSRVVDFLMG